MGLGAQAGLPVLLNGKQVKPIPPFAKTAKSWAPAKSETQLRSELLAVDQPSVVIRKMQNKEGKGEKNEAAMIAKD